MLWLYYLEVNEFNWYRTPCTSTQIAQL